MYIGFFEEVNGRKERVKKSFLSLRQKQLRTLIFTGTRNAESCVFYFLNFKG